MIIPRILLEILCPPIREVKFGQYDPTDCSEQKQAHGTSCTLTCSGGFKVEKGPETKICGGKKTGIWSKKNQHPKCVGKILKMKFVFIVFTNLTIFNRYITTTYRLPEKYNFGIEFIQ